MKCEDCIHYDVCFDASDVYFKLPVTSENVETDCEFFKDKSLIIELPCKVGDTFYANWFASKHSKEYECIGFKYGLHDGKTDTIMLITSYGMDFVYGEEAFLTKEEAEKKLKEEEKENEQSDHINN